LQKKMQFSNAGAFVLTRRSQEATPNRV